jgi:flagellar protein FlaG
MLADNISTIKSQYDKPDSMVVSPDAAPRHSKPERKAEQPEIRISQAMLNNVQHEIQKVRNLGLQFSVHKATGRTMVKVVDKETEKLIREIPPEDLLNLVDKLDEMIGILFDKKV